MYSFINENTFQNSSQLSHYIILNYIILYYFLTAQVVCFPYIGLYYDLKLEFNKQGCIAQKGDGFQ